jgi:ATP-dependent helicase HrpB
VTPLPVDALLGELLAALDREGSVIVEAEPGDGKTTRIPRALVESGRFGQDLVIVTEPRRLAARLAATFVAAERGESVGETVGYNVRFDKAEGKRTRLLYVTEGVLLRRLMRDPRLSGVGAVVLDEVHERHLETDLLLALITRLRRSTRPDLALVVMSATLESERLATHLSAPRLHSSGREFPIEVTYEQGPDDRPLDARVASASRSLLSDTPSGNVLVFLPGASEIRRADERLKRLSETESVEVLPLHGDLPIAEQARAVAPSSHRKVILATNVAESSVTVSGVTAVVDSGLATMATHSPWSGLSRLEVRPISRASAKQRAGRAGRQGPGVVVRLYSRADLERRPAHDAPEITRLDFAESLLFLCAMGIRDATALHWLDPPPSATIETARATLRALGAATELGELTPIGIRMSRLPLAPRLARLVVAAEDRGIADLGCLAAALLSERDIRQGARTSFRGDRTALDVPTGPSDVLELIDRYREAEEMRFADSRLRRLGLEPRAASTVRRTYQNVRRRSLDSCEAPTSPDDVDRQLARAVLLAYPDRVARRRAAGEPALVLVNGQMAELAPESAVRHAAFLVALEAAERGGKSRRSVVRIASAIEPDWLLEDLGDRIETSESLEWNAERRRVERTSRLCIGSLVLDEDQGPATPSPEAAVCLVAAAEEAGLPRAPAVRSLLARLAVLAQKVPELDIPPLGDEAVYEALRHLAEETVSLDDLQPDLLALALFGALPSSAQQALESEAPTRVTLPSGRTLVITYELGKAPWVASRMQDFFGMEAGPMICRGRLPLTLHLLAPNQRPVQVTSDLAGFWDRHYGELRRALARRYPKHDFPEDPRTARPPSPRPGRPAR